MITRPIPIIGIYWRTFYTLRVNWAEEKYVKGQRNGEIVKQPKFSGTPFQSTSLVKLITLHLFIGPIRITWKGVGRLIHFCPYGWMCGDPMLHHSTISNHFTTHAGHDLPITMQVCFIILQRYCINKTKHLPTTI